MASKLKTDLLITSLVSDLQNQSPSKNWFSLYWFSWLSCFSLMAVLTYFAAAAFPADIHLPQDLKSVSFWTETAMWFLLSVVGAIIGFLSAVPAKRPAKLLKLAYAGVLVLGLTLVLHESPAAIASEFSEEAHWHRGPCGFFILINGILAAGGMFFILRKAAPTDLNFTALWTAVSLGSMGSMFMHLVCTHESTAHALIWHVTPMLMIVILATGFSQKLLRW